MSGHTPGPWATTGRVYTTSVQGHQTIAVAVFQKNVAQAIALVYAGFGEGTANAHLIAAAPKMLAKLEECAGWCAECGGTGKAVTLTEGGEYGPDEECADCKDIRALIAEAKGGAS